MIVNINFKIKCSIMKKMNSYEPHRKRISIIAILIIKITLQVALQMIVVAKVANLL